MSYRSQKVISVVVAAAFLAGAFQLAVGLNGQRKALGLARLELTEQARPDLLTNVLLSVGRALVVDYLWIGLEEMKQEGRYFDAQQRAEWICRLQPNMPGVWVFQAWNMSYNISVAMNTAEDRWRWVRNGLELLRDRGIPLNPNSRALYHQLAWIYHHKVGGTSDDYHWYYKKQLAQAIEPIVGWPDERYEVMYDAPRTWAALLRTPGMPEYVKALEDMKFNVRQDFLRILAKPDEQGEKVRVLLLDPQYEECRRALEGFIRRDRLWNEWKLDADVIKEIRQPGVYGPLDFRTPQAHAIYWAYLSFKRLGDDQSFFALNTNRIIYACVQELFRRGRFFIPADNGYPVVTPDIRFIPVYHRIVMELRNRYPEDRDLFRSGHVNFLEKAISYCYMFNDMAEGRKYWKILNDMYPNPERYGVGFDKFIRSYLLEEIRTQSHQDTSAAVIGYLMRAYLLYARGDDYAAFGQRRLGKALWFAYNAEKWGRSEERVRLPSFEELDKQALDMALKSLPPDLGEHLMNLIKGLKEASRSAGEGK